MSEYDARLFGFGGEAAHPVEHLCPALRGLIALRNVVGEDSDEGRFENFGVFERAADAFELRAEIAVERELTERRPDGRERDAFRVRGGADVANLARRQLEDVFAPDAAEFDGFDVLFAERRELFVQVFRDFVGERAESVCHNERSPSGLSSWIL